MLLSNTTTRTGAILSRWSQRKDTEKISIAPALRMTRNHKESNKFFAIFEVPRSWQFFWCNTRAKMAYLSEISHAGKKVPLVKILGWRINMKLPSISRREFVKRVFPWRGLAIKYTYQSTHICTAVISMQ